MDELDFTPEGEGAGLDYEFSQAKTPEEFRAKAEMLLSNTMDLLNAKIQEGMAEASDLKTAVDIAKMFKVGIETVDEAAERALRDAAQFTGVDDADDSEDAMRFSG